MAEVGDKIYLSVTKNDDGKLIVDGDEGFYRDHTEKEIENLSEEVNGQKVIIWTVAEVNEEGKQRDILHLSLIVSVALVSYCKTT